MTKVGSVQNFIRSHYYANRSLKMAKDPLSHIDVKVNADYVGDIIRENIPSFSDYAKMHGLNVKIAQKGKSLLINSGLYTEVTSLEGKSSKDICNAILDNINCNINAKVGKPC